MTGVNWDYIAGFVDGEGSLSIAKQGRYFHPRISIAQNTASVLEEIQVFFSMNGIKSSIYRNVHKPRGNVWYNLRVQDRASVLNICTHMSGRLRVKHRQLNVLVRLLTIKSGNATRTDLKEQGDRFSESDKCRRELMALNQEREAA